MKKTTTKTKIQQQIIVTKQFENKIPQNEKSYCTIYSNNKNKKMQIIENEPMKKKRLDKHNIMFAKYLIENMPCRISQYKTIKPKLRK